MPKMIAVLFLLVGSLASAQSLKIEVPENQFVLQGVIYKEADEDPAFFPDDQIVMRYFVEIQAYDRNGKLRLRGFQRKHPVTKVPHHQTVMIYDAEGNDLTNVGPLSPADDLSAEDFDSLVKALRSELTETSVEETMLSPISRAKPVESSCPVRVTFRFVEGSEPKPAVIESLKSMCN